MMLATDDLPDYQEQGEANIEYDIRPSTSRQHGEGSDLDDQVSNQESINHSETRDGAEDQGNDGDQPLEEIGGDEDIILVDDDDVSIV